MFSNAKSSRDLFAGPATKWRQVVAIDASLWRSGETRSRSPEGTAGRPILSPRWDLACWVGSRIHELTLVATACRPVGTGRARTSHEVATDCSHWCEPMDIGRNEMVESRRDGRSYCLTGTPLPLAGNVACTDYSVVKGGKLVAYQWDGEQVLLAKKFHWDEQTP